MSRPWDVIIVGAGPAGSVTAQLLASAGVRVLLLDRHSFPRAKPCGDCLSAATTDVLRRLGLLDRVLALPHARLEGWRIIAPDGGWFAARFASEGAAPIHAIACERMLFDDALLTAAVDAGVEFRRVHVHEVTRDAARFVNGVITSAGTFSARAVVGADGLRSITASRSDAVRRRPRLRKVSLTARLHAPALASPFGEMHVGDGVVAGIAALDAHGRCNFTVVADADRFGRALAADPIAFVQRAALSLPQLRDRVSPELWSGAELLASGPFDRPMRAVVFDGLALVGDAGGYYDPFTGQGIHQALRSAELLAPVLAAALECAHVTAAALRPYAAQRHRLLRGTRAVQQLIEVVLARPRVANAAIARVARARHFAAALIAVTGDMRPPSRLLSPAALVSLLAP